MESKNNILLLGAGLTKNFGGPLASEMWSLISCHSLTVKNNELKKHLQKDEHIGNFELAYSTISPN